MQNNNEETILCSSCKKNISSSNFALHEPHCRRFLCLCPDCDEPVPREQLNEHRKEQHSQVNCPKCSVKVERCHLIDHESDECKDRLVSCEFCQLDLPLSVMAEHTVACGSRTERCLDCGRYVTLKDQLHHAQTCSSSAAGDTASHVQEASAHNTKKPTLALCWECKGYFPSEDLGEHLLECASSTPAEAQEEVEEEQDSASDSESGLKLSDVLAGRRRGELDQISTCSICHLALPMDTLRWHEKKCRIFENLKCVK
ncbi:XIAP-associated factor 1 [Clupea harengus]|uniref:XIAP-associated factor 1 n=1 Tax=Clupea harengus TaxID=7950 RepID=A0A6P8FLZ0_CLUHA|nr:XIAP-associated factor 1 [Clupea harengus]